MRAGALEAVQAGRADWMAPDEALPEHPPVLWRKRQFPKRTPRYLVNNILSVLDLVAQGLGVGVLPTFLADGRKDLLRLGDPIGDSNTAPWLLAHPESRHLRRVSVTHAHLALAIRLPD